MEYIILIIVNLIIGIQLGRYIETNYWVDHSDSKYRTAIWHKGKMYYVITDEEYCNKFLNITFEKEDK